MRTFGEFDSRRRPSAALPPVRRCNPLGLFRKRVVREILGVQRRRKSSRCGYGSDIASGKAEAPPRGVAPSNAGEGLLRRRRDYEKRERLQRRHLLCQRKELSTGRRGDGGLPLR